MSIIQNMHRSLAIVGLLALTTLCAYATDLTSTASTAAVPPIGTRDTVRADPHVPRPSGTPCVLELVRNGLMNSPGLYWPPDGDPYLPYAPPADCPGPWAKVILKVAFFNEAPNTYLDGFVAARVEIGDVDLPLPLLYSGGAQDNGVPTHWRAERDVTDYSAILRAPGFSLLRIIGETRYGGFNSPYYVSATLLFYPANPQNKAPRVPDAVYPADESVVLPRNVERAYLDVIAHGNYLDLFWFTCMPNAAIAAFPELRSPLAIGVGRVGLEGEPPLEGCGNGSFREVQVSIDGQPAGVAPVFPRFYPRSNALWRTERLLQPLPTPQALNFMPYRVDLTPFAGLLSDGVPHTVDISVAGSGDASDFSATGALLVYRDAGSAQTTGSVTRNTLAGQAPTPSVTSTLARDSSGAVGGTVVTALTRTYAIEGYVDTSRGRIRSTVERTIRFDNLQVVPRAYDAPGGLDADEYSQAVELKSTAEGKSRRYLDGNLIAEDREYTSYPLSLIYRFGSTELQQGFSQRTERWRPGITRYYTNLSNEVDLAYTDPDVSVGNTEWRGHQVYTFRDSYSSCYRTELNTEGGALTDYQQGKNCPGDTNRLYWASHPDGSPDGLGWAER